MKSNEQFEIWVLQDHDTHWSMLAAFADFDVANALARSRKNRFRLVRTEFAAGHQIAADVLAEVGATRTGY